MELTKEEILKYAVYGAKRELQSAKRIFGVEHENYKHTEEVCHILDKLYQKERIKNLGN